jgi:hypothetical protein
MTLPYATVYNSPAVGLYGYARTVMLVSIYSRYQKANKRTSEQTNTTHTHTHEGKKEREV